ESDVKILRVLAKDARAPVVAIAREAGLSEKTVENRIKAMAKKGVIASFRTLFDLDLLGVQYYKIHFKLQGMTPEKLKEMRAYARGHPNVVYDNEVLGGADFEIDVQARGEKEFRALLDEMRKKFAEHIRSHEVLRYYREYKLEFLPAREAHENE
ncbi:MAG: Lrp/AsnC family transcriptional regulator, partial [Candidatus Micrarchaeota archaeon]